MVCGDGRWERRGIVRDCEEGGRGKDECVSFAFYRS